MKQTIALMLALAGAALLYGCAPTASPPAAPTQAATEAPAPTEKAAAAEYRKITAEQARAMMQSGGEYILLDVRTQPEYDESHIDGALLIPDTELAARAPTELPEKGATILVYCRSGRRSEISARKLVEMGYTGVYDFGGIIDWPYDTAFGRSTRASGAFNPEPLRWVLG